MKIEPKWCPRGSQEAPKRYLFIEPVIGILFPPLWDALGTILGPYWNPFGFHCSYFLDMSFRPISEGLPDTNFYRFWYHFGIHFGSIFGTCFRHLHLVKIEPLSNESSIMEGPRDSCFTLFCYLFRTLFPDPIFIDFEWFWAPFWPPFWTMLAPFWASVGRFKMRVELGRILVKSWGWHRKFGGMSGRPWGGRGGTPFL